MTSDELSKRIEKICSASEVFTTTRKLKTCLPSLKATIPKDLRSHVVYQIDCTGCGSCYVGQTIRHLRTRLSEHLRDSAPVGSHLVSCSGTDKWEYKVLDSSRGITKLPALEALYIDKEKPTLNTRDEYRSRPLTIRL